MNQQILYDDVNEFASKFQLGKSLRNKTFLVTGATGLIGSVMIYCLLALNAQYNLGIRVIAIVRSKDKFQKVFGDKSQQIECRTIELTNISLDSVGCDVDYIIHLASPTASKYFVEHPVETIKISVEGTLAILEYAVNVKAKGVVYASSLEVYGCNHSDDLINENFQGYLNPVEVRSSYNMSKRLCECLCHSYAKEYGLNVMIARMTQTMGAGVEYNDNRVFAQFARQAIEGRDIELHTAGQTCRMYCYTTDVVSALLYICIKGVSGEAYNVANKDSYISIQEMATLIKDNFNSDIKVLFVPKEGLGYAPETKIRLSTDKVEALGWKPNINLLEMFTRLINYMK